MSERRIIRQGILSVAATLTLLVWPNISRATTIAHVGVINNWTSSTPGLFIATVQYPTPTAWNAGAAAANVSPGAFAPTGLIFTAGLNLTDNDVIMDADNAVDAQAAYSFLYQAAAAGYNGGSWDTSPGAGVGLFSDSTALNTTQSAATDPLQITGIGVVLNDGHGANISGNDPAYTSFDDLTVNANSVLVKFTYYGDTDLDGIVENRDINRTLGAFSSDQTVGPSDQRGWANGESDYSGTVDMHDVDLAHEAFGSQSDDAIVLPSHPTPAVPEAASALLAAIGAVGMIFVRRRYSAVQVNR
jgi:hypothetical protein